MADTIITNSPDREAGAGGWIVALVIVVAVILGAVFLYQRGTFRRAAPADTNINVTIPAQNDNGSGQQQGGGTGGNQNQGGQQQY